MRILLGSLMLTLLVLPVSAQQISRQEVGLGLQTSGDHPYGLVPELKGFYGEYLFGSPELRYTLNLNRNLALEAEGSTSWNGVPTSVREGGHQTLALGGIKAGFRRGRWGFFATSAAGAVSFSQAEGLYQPDGSIVYNRLTHFALRQGAAVELSVSQRTFLRFDAAELLDAQFRRIYVRTPSYEATSYSGVPYHLLTSVSVEHRFGALETLDAPADERKTHGYSVGGLYEMGVREHLLENDARADGGGGAWVGVPVWRFVSADVVAFDEPHDDHTDNLQDGGTLFAGFAGPKAGFRKGSFGFYGKARPGLVRFSRTEAAVSVSGRGIFFQERPKYNFALDTGLVLEYSPAARGFRHVLTRFEGGSDFIHYHETSVATSYQPRRGPPVYEVDPAPPQRKSGLVFLVGVGYTF
jgi:hypothetical protein